jgi:CDP-paratose 2-epimerase
MSCIYGSRQWGTEDQGWVAHFLIKALRGEPITVYGDGKQVRDILNVRDAVAAYRGVLDGIDRVSGNAFNLGGGAANAVSVAEALDEIARQCGTVLDISRSDWRTGDQLYFVADTRRLRDAIGWRATIGWRQGVAQLRDWLVHEFGIAPAAARETRRIRA